MQNQKKILAFLSFKNHPSLKQRLPLFQGQNIVGRVSQKANVVIKDSQISSMHAKIKVSDQQMTISDLGSKNGTCLDSDTKEKILKGQQFDLVEGQSFFLGQVQCYVERVPQSRRQTVSNKKTTKVIQQKLNVLMELDELSEQQQKNGKSKQNVTLQSSSLASKVAQTKPSKEVKKPQKQKKVVKKIEQTEDESDLSQSELEIPNKKQMQTKTKATNEKQVQKEQKQKKDKKQKIQKDNKSKSEKERKAKLQQQKKQKQLKQKKQQQERQRKQNEQKLKRQQEQRLIRQQQEKQKQEKQKKKKDTKKDKNAPKNKPQEDIQIDKTHEEKNKRGRKSKSNSADKNKKEKSKKPTQRQQTSIESKNSRTNSQKKKTSEEKPPLKTKDRKRAPSDIQGYEDLQQKKGYNLRRNFLRQTKFKISGPKIKFYPFPELKLVDDKEEQYDVLVMQSYIRTYKLLFSISKGIPIVSKAWLVDCQLYKKTLQVDRYWLEYPGDKWLIRDSIKKRKQGQMIFKNMEFYLGSNLLNLKTEEVQRLIYNGGGSVILYSVKMKNDKSYAKKLNILLDKNFTKEEEERAKSINKEKIYDLELILEGTLRQELDLEKHKLNL